MDIELTLKNYRCFEDTKPARLHLRKGFISFIGVNNSGKSTLLKFFHEFRPIFQSLSEKRGLLESFSGPIPAPSYGLSVKDRDEILCNSNNRDLEVEINLRERQLAEGHDFPCPDKIIIKILRNHDWVATIYINDEKVDTKDVDIVENRLSRGGKAVLDVQPIFEVFSLLTRTLYIGPFRNAVNVGTNENYWDIRVGQSFISLWRAHKTGIPKRNTEALIRLTDNIKRIFGFNTLEINSAEGDVDLKISVDGSSFTLSELGAGLAQFIVVFGNVAISNPSPSFILIDEPELNLHPALQLDF